MHRRALKTCFIVNPRSGGASRVLHHVQRFATKHGATIRLTERRGHAPELAQRSLEAGFELIVAAGGDGTLNEVGRALVGTSGVLGLVPCGSGNGLGRHLGIHGSIRHVLDILHHGRIAVIDSGIVNGHAFFTAAGIGFEAEIAERFNRLRRRGFARYLSTAALAFRAFEPERYVITQADIRETVDAFTLTATNASQYGNNALISPDARVDDGLLDLCTLPPIRAWQLPPLAAHLFHGSIGRVAGVRIRRAPSFVVERARPGLLHTDGETHLTGERLEFTVRPASLRIMTPA